MTRRREWDETGIRNGNKRQSRKEQNLEVWFRGSGNHALWKLKNGTRREGGEKEGEEFMKM